MSKQSSPHMISHLLFVHRDDCTIPHSVQYADQVGQNRFPHTPSFLGLKYSDELVLLELTFISGRPKETRLALLRELNERVVAAAGISPDDLLIMLYEIPGENVSFGQGVAQRAFISGGT